VTECSHGGLANRRIDGAWVEVPCDPASPWVCWPHKMKAMRESMRNGADPLGGGMPFKSSIQANVTQLGLAQETFDSARSSGGDLQRA